ncbi:hypothetical protein GCM10010327_39810 [Streptomyces nitrosporeus]|nr:hypothetical protein GCM10010327_39810 [Streptomyces nitrosporeus]
MTEFAGKVYGKEPGTPVRVDVTGVRGVAVPLFTAAGPAASVVTRALGATRAPPESMPVRAAVPGR